MMNERQIKRERCGLKIPYNKAVQADILYFGFSRTAIVFQLQNVYQYEIIKLCEMYFFGKPFLENKTFECF